MCKKLILIASMLLAVAGCSKSNVNEEKVPPRSSVYSGSLNVVAGGKDNITEGVEVNADIDKDGVLTLVFHKVKFVPQMPVSLDVTVLDVKYSREADGSLLLSGDGIVPITMMQPYPKYTVTGLSGKMSDKALSISLNFGEFPTSYSGNVVE